MGFVPFVGWLGWWREARENFGLDDFGQGEIMQPPLVASWPVPLAALGLISGWMSRTVELEGTQVSFVVELRM